MQVPDPRGPQQIGETVLLNVETSNSHLILGEARGPAEETGHNSCTGSWMHLTSTEDAKEKTLPL